VASGVQRLHAADPPIMHGDLKTSNLLLDDEGRVVIADFGLACSVRGTVAPGGVDSPKIGGGGALTISISPPEVLNNPYAPRTPATDGACTDQGSDQSNRHLQDECLLIC
jgi:serine/threonine protein kinase